MKKFWIIIFLSGCFIIPVKAQQTPSLKYNELGISFYDLNGFGFRYKHGNDKTMFRLSMLTLDVVSNNQKIKMNNYPESKQSGYGLGMRIGFDNRVPLYKNFSLLLGGELGINYLYQTINNGDSITSSTSKHTQWTISPGVSFIFGINCVIREHLVLGAELNPTLAYSYSETKNDYPYFHYKTTSTNFSFNASTSGAGVYIAYR
ncbi:MAG: hypothetical protein Q8867_08385, partial [Bacteroidota bacterium]|nr:hypothetical protein [Bacteroidota bacterium]